MSTMREVGALAGVSAKTVSRVMNNDRYVSEAVRIRVQQAIEELGYVPNALARTFRSGRDAAIGIAVPDIADPFFAMVVKGIEQAARSRGTATFVTSLGEDPAGEQAAVEALLVRQVVGLVLAPVAPDQGYLRAWRARTALVFIDRHPRNVTAESVVEDDVGGARDATLHLVAHGHRRVAFIGDSLLVPTTARRLDGYTAALHASGLDVEPELVALTSAVPGGAPDVLDRLDSIDRRPTAIFSSNARCSLELLPHLHRRGGADIAFVSFGDFPMAGTLTPTVTVVDQDPAKLAAVAARRLFDRVDNPTRTVRRQKVLPLKLVLRESCAAPDEPAGTRTLPCDHVVSPARR